ncbi:uncharacterized protein Bfra_010496 [Botrytis fragariae]|uniref:Uncharacterized protein n=1 Tax=Botrytis fragariae TaxID=1964551 RepID=A0A8H6AHH0_9HELO|nr:uncharacterized protein Bfra_010496 [Botrytis fragariae]KAF5867522.1 hypothetical protein Bfra_010496 [Botrytis fragariae]
MRFSTLSVATISVALASAQTPADSWPITSRNIGCAFGNVTVTPGKWISPSDVTTQPSIYRTTSIPNANTNTTYMLLMLDLSIPSSDVTTPRNTPPSSPVSPPTPPRASTGGKETTPSHLPLPLRKPQTQSSSTPPTASQRTPRRARATPQTIPTHFISSHSRRIIFQGRKRRMERIMMRRRRRDLIFR